MKSYPAFLIENGVSNVFITCTKRSGSWVTYERPAIDVYPEYDYPPQIYICGEWLLLATTAGVLVSKDDGETWLPAPTIFTDHMWAEGKVRRSGTAYSVYKFGRQTSHDLSAEEVPFLNAEEGFVWDVFYTPRVPQIRWYTSMIIDGTIYVLYASTTA
ncbi:MAG: hypothetical protein WC455_23380 [Dehalococcoidia bacterium]|jgi:hypothetical protein